MPSTDLIFRFLGIDAGAGREFDRMAGKVDTAGVKWKAWALGAGVAVGTVAAAAIHLADEWEQAHTRLEGAITNVGGNFDSLAGQVSGLDSHMAKFGFTATDVESSLAPLVTATKNPTQAIHLMGLAADVARGRNIDLATATNLLVKVETGHISLLGRYGIATKDASGHTITMTQAIQRLTTLYGGDAQRFAGTFTGKLAALKAEATNLGIKIGSALIPVVTDLLTAFEKVGAVVGAVVDWFRRHRTVTLTLAAALTGVLLPAMIRTVAVFVAAKISAFGDALATLVIKVLGTQRAMAVANRQTSIFSAGLKSLNPATLIATAALVGGTIAWQRSSATTAAAKSQVDDYVNSLHTVPGSIASLNSSVATMKQNFAAQMAEIDQSKGAWGVVSGGAEEYRAKLQELEAQQQTVSQNERAISNQYHLSVPQVEALANANGIDLSGALSSVQQGFAGVKTAANTSKSPMAQAKGLFDDMTRSTTDAATALTDFGNTFDNLVGNFVSMKQAQIQFKNDLVATIHALAKSHDAIGQNNQASRDAGTAFYTLVGDIKSVTGATYTNSKSWDKARVSAQQMLKQLEQLPVKGPAVSRVISGLRQEIAGMGTAFQGTAAKASSSISQIEKQLAGLTSAPHVIHITTLKQILTLPTQGGGGGGGGGPGKNKGGLSTQSGQDGRQQSLDFTAGIRSGIPDAQKAATDLVDAAAASVTKNTKSPTTVKTVKESAKHVAHLLFIGLRDGWRGESSSLKSALATPLQNALAHMTTVLGKELSKQQAQLSNAESAYKSLRQARTQAISSLKGSIAGSADISGVLGLTDVNGNTYTGNVRSLLGSQLSVIREEASKIGRLRKMGLSEALLRQISAAAPADAVTLANQILSGQDGSIASLNKQENLIQKYAKQTATTVVESPAERHQLMQAKAQVRLQREQVQEQRKTNKHLERIAAHDIAHGVSITLSGHTFNPSKPHDLRKLVAELKKLGHNVSVG